jgi:glucuronate isomerase
MLASQGIEPARLGVPRLDGGPVETDSRKIWRTFCENWKLFRGTPSRYWLEHELVEVFGVDQVPSAETADAIYDQIAACVADPKFRPRALLDRFNIEVISTTDSAPSDLKQHAKLAADGLSDRVFPTFRPDAVAYLDRPTWRDDIEELGKLTRIDTTTYDGFLDSLRTRRAAFIDAGARATDHGHLLADTTPMDLNTARELYTRVLGGAEPSQAEVDAFAANMLYQMADMSCEDGLVMQIHPGVLRDHNSAIFTTYGSDKGYDISIQTEFTRGLRPMLDQFGTDPRFRVILFTVDETVYSRELAPIAGTYPSVRLGAPWWFLDSPEGMRRFREFAVETAGFYNTSGFVDDTRAFASIPARHDLYRRVDAGFLARLVLEHRLSLEEAAETAVDLAYRLPKESYPRP